MLIIGGYGVKTARCQAKYEKHKLQEVHVPYDMTLKQRLCDISLVLTQRIWHGWQAGNKVVISLLLWTPHATYARDI